jgi:hypothetical protein
MSLSNIGDTVALLNNGSNSDSVPATVPGSELVRQTRQRLNLGSHPQQSGAHRNATSVSQVAPDRRWEWLSRPKLRGLKVCDWPSEQGV